MVPDFDLPSSGPSDSIQMAYRSSLPSLRVPSLEKMSLAGADPLQIFLDEVVAAFKSFAPSHWEKMTFDPSPPFFSLFFPPFFPFTRSVCYFLGLSASDPMKEKMRDNIRERVHVHQQPPDSARTPRVTPRLSVTVSTAGTGLFSRGKSERKNKVPPSLSSHLLLFCPSLFFSSSPRRMPQPSSSSSRSRPIPTSPRP